MRTNAILMGLALVAGLGACDALSGGATGNDVAHVNLRLTDAPAELSAATVQIKQIYLVGDEADTAGAESGRVVLFEGDRTYDLLDLQNGVTADLANIAVPAGSYQQLRLVVGDVSLTTLSGETFSTADGTLKCPSCAQSGLKVNLPGEGLRLQAAEHVVVLDFDVAQSFGHEAGKSGNWIMHPVITATQVEVAGSIEGAVSLATGVTLPSCGGASTTFADFVPKATAGSVSLTTQPDTTGAFRFALVPAGSYTMTSQDTVSFANGDTLIFAATPTPALATVVSGDSTVVNYTVDSAVCTAA